MHLAIDLYVKLLKQVKRHLNTAYTVAYIVLGYHKYFQLKPLTETVS